MSYTIVYKRSFLKIEGKYMADNKERYIPLILAGSNNCYDYRGRRSRGWGPMFNQPIMTKYEILDKAKGIKDEEECFVYKSKWLFGKDYEPFLYRGINAAKTIEEMVEASEGLSLYLSDKNSADTLYAHTTPEIIDWINAHSGSNIFIQFSPEEFKLSAKPADGPFAIKGTQNRFVTHFDRNNEGDVCRISLGPRKDAMCFESHDDAKDVIHTFRDLRIVQYKNITKNKPWRVCSQPDLFVKRLSSRRLFFTTEASTARQFASKTEAEKYIIENLAPRFNGNFQAIEI